MPILISPEISSRAWIEGINGLLPRCAFMSISPEPAAGHNSGETVTLAGDPIDRAKQALEVAQHQVMLAEGGANPNLEEALVEVEDALVQHQDQISGAVEQDQFDAEQTGEAERRRLDWRPPSP